MKIVRNERPEDIAAIHDIHKQAFNSLAEADLVDMLRANGKASISLVAVDDDDRILGHILFSPVTIEPAQRAISALGLAPMAVLPEFQRQGIGSLLVSRGLEECRKAGHDCVVVLGHPRYYPRFGFAPASRYGIKSEFDVPDEAFMVLELNEKALPRREATAKYQPEFNRWI
jgi:putative acetyltransferase